MTCNHNWSEETHEGVPSRFCHVCNEWEIVCSVFVGKREEP
jgi:hypothetical protein